MYGITHCCHPLTLHPHSLTSPAHTFQEAALVLKLFRLVIVGLTLPEGEPLLVAPLTRTLEKSLEGAVAAVDPTAYLSLLRILLKGCASCREPLKLLYAEVAPQLPGLLDALLDMMNGPNCGEVSQHGGPCWT